MALRPLTALMPRTALIRVITIKSAVIGRSFRTNPFKYANWLASRTSAWAIKTSCQLMPSLLESGRPASRASLACASEARAWSVCRSCCCAQAMMTTAAALNKESVCELFVGIAATFCIHSMATAKWPRRYMTTSNALILNRKFEVMS